MSILPSVALNVYFALPCRCKSILYIVCETAWHERKWIWNSLRWVELSLKLYEMSGTESETVWEKWIWVWNCVTWAELNLILYNDGWNWESYCTSIHKCGDGNWVWICMILLELSLKLYDVEWEWVWNCMILLELSLKQYDLGWELRLNLYDIIVGIKSETVWHGLELSLTGDGQNLRSKTIGHAILFCNCVQHRSR